jgi:hypothetical protein
MLDGKPLSLMAFTIRGGKVAEIDILHDPARLSQLDLTSLTASAVGTINSPPGAIVDGAEAGRTKSM